MKDQARFIAYRILTEVEEAGAYSNLTLNKEMNQAHLSALDRGLTTELVYGVLRMRGHLDYIIDQFSKRPVKSLDIGVATLLRLGVYQLKFLDKIPSRAAVHATVEVTKKEHHGGIVKFVNGVLRNIDRKLDQVQFPTIDTDPVEHIATVYSHPRWLVQKWLDRFGVQETIQLCASNNWIPELTIRTNTLKINPATLADRLDEEYHLSVHLLPYPPEGMLLESGGGFLELEPFKKGLFTVQGQASMLVAHALDVKPGMKVADLCAAPGGKTTHLAALMENQGEILAIDLHEHKMELIESNCRRLGVKVVETLCADTSSLTLEAEQYDRILLDAPCSGLGLLAQKPEIRWMKEPKEIKELAHLQKTLFKKGLRWLKPGGIMVYSTCTITLEENQEVLEEILRTEDVELLDLRSLLPIREIEYLKEAGMDSHYLEFLPHISETEGFFIAAVQKKSEK